MWTVLVRDGAADVLSRYRWPKVDEIAISVISDIWKNNVCVTRLRVRFPSIAIEFGIDWYQKQSIYLHQVISIETEFFKDYRFTSSRS